jgi:UDPglucose 6-dehydrogenase
VLGLTFKPDTDDMRESPAIGIIDGLIKRGAKVQAYDPVGMENARKVIKDSVEYCADAYETAAGADALLLLTAWNEFKRLDMARVKELMRQPVLVDGRNIYDPGEMKELGFKYSGVGRR